MSLVVDAGARNIGTESAFSLVRRPTRCVCRPYTGHLPNLRLQNNPRGVWRRHKARSFAVASAASEAADAVKVKYDHLLLAILDKNPYLSDASKQAIAATGNLAAANKSKVTVLLIDEKEPTEDPATRLDTITWHLNDSGCPKESIEFLERDLGGGEGNNSASVAVGDVADEIKADLLVLSSTMVHSKAVDANLLAEFVPCPMLLLP